MILPLVATIHSARESFDPTQRSHGAVRAVGQVAKRCRPATWAPRHDTSVHGCSLLSTVMICLSAVILCIIVQIHDLDMLMGSVKYSLAAYRSETGLSSKGLLTFRAFYRKHRIDVIEGMPVRGSHVLHISNVCLEGGKNGLVVPHLHSYEALGILEDYRPGSHKPVAFREMDPRDASTIFGDTDSGATMIRGPTFFINCWNRAPRDTNPSHWLMKVNKMYEIAEVARSRKAGRLALPLFRHLAFHQCPSYNINIKDGAWPWGVLIMEAASRYWTEARLWDGPDKVDVIEMTKTDRHWICFEEFFFETGYNSWYPAPQYRSSWLQTLNGMVPEPGLSISVPSPNSSSLPLRTNVQEDKNQLFERCSAGGLRIHLFQRSTGSTLRAFANLEEVVAMLQNLTTVPVPIVTVNHTTALANQIAAFRAFDVLVTPHGSQIGNIIFSDPHATAIVEVSPVVRDIAFYENAIDANFSSYVLSTGHTPWPSHWQRSAICDEGEKMMKENCQLNDRLEAWRCPREWSSKLTVCDTFVNVSLLETHVRRAIFKLCERLGTG